MLRSPLPVLLSSVLVLLLPACDPEVEGDEAGECDDGVDNDLDGQTDCDEADCAAATACVDGPDDEDVDTTLVLLVGYASGEQAKLEMSAELVHPDVAAEDIPEIFTGDSRGLAYHLRSGSPELVFVGADSGTELARGVVELQPDGLTVVLLNAVAGTVQYLAATAEERGLMLEADPTSQLLLWGPSDRFTLKFHDEEQGAYTEAYAFGSTPEWDERVAPDADAQAWGCYCLADSEVASECAALGLENSENSGLGGLRVMLAAEATDVSWSYLRGDVAVGELVIPFTNLSSTGYGWGAHTFLCTLESYQNGGCSPSEWWRPSDAFGGWSQSGCPLPTDW